MITVAIVLGGAVVGAAAGLVAIWLALSLGEDHILPL